MTKRTLQQQNIRLQNLITELEIKRFHSFSCTENFITFIGNYTINNEDYMDKAFANLLKLENDKSITYTDNELFIYLDK